MLSQNYNDSVVNILRKISETQSENIQKAGALIANALNSGNILHLFGAGHSHMLVEEGFYRAGGLMPVNPLFDSAVMLHGGALKSSAVERVESYAEMILDNYSINPGDAIIIFSNSARNELVVGMADSARKRGMKVILVYSASYKDSKSRHSSGKRAEGFADIAIDNCCPYGDALVELPGQNMSIAPGSTVAGATILNMISVSIAEALIKMGGELEYLVSANIDNVPNRNAELLEKYKGKIKAL
ncbi:MAG: SIS domain-containing protein [Oscillospiraceae bacterium]|nr:SIS domain-containing protein [Oscillospiraceae bacterium]